MDDPDFSVSLVKLESTNQDEHIDEEMQTTSSCIGNSKDCHLLWESLRRQSQLSKVLDTLTNKTTRLVARIQAQTASEDDSEVAVQLLSQLGVLFVEVETSEDGVKEKRYTFVTDVETQQNKQTKAETVQQDNTEPKAVPATPALTTASTTPEQEESDEDMADGFEQDDGSEKENTANNGDEQTPKTSCDLCHEVLSSPVMLDFHKLRFCEVMKKTRVRSRVKKCPSCGDNFKHQERLYNHLVDVHGTEVSEAMKILTELETNEPDPLIKPVPLVKPVSTPEKPGSSKAVGMESSPKVMNCEICEEYFQNRIQLRTHLIEEHDFSRQKAVSSVCEAVKLAQLQHQEEPVSKKADPSGQFHCVKCDSTFDEGQKLVQHMVSSHDMTLSKSEKMANKQQLELDSSKFACDLCPSKFSVRGRLSKHLVEGHGLLIKVVRSKIETMYPRKSDAMFACDLCSTTCCKRYVLSRHLIAKHGLSKKQVWKKTNKLYPLGDTKATSVSTRSKVHVHSTQKGKAQDNNSRRSQRISLERGAESNKPERMSRRLAMKEKDKNKDEEMGEKSHNEATEDESGEDKTMKHDNKEINGKEAKTADHDELGSDNDDEDKADEEDIDDSEDDDDEYVPSDVEFGLESLDGTQKTAEQPPRKRGRPRKSLKDDGDTPSRPDDKEDEPAEETAKESPRKRGRPRKTPNPEQDPEKVKQKIPKKRGRPCWKPDPDGNYKCPKCDKTFQSLYYAKSHMNSIHREQPAFNCSTCKKAFHFRNTFMRHLNCHKNEEMGIKFTCELCGKVFFDKYNLGTHIKTHNAEKPFKCEFCGRGFFHQSLLVRHRNLHTKDVEYKCTVCDKVFYRKGGLTYHMLSNHEKIKKFVCKVCGQAFATKSSLTAHAPTHNNSRPFQCDICGTRVKTKGNLKEHMTCVHTDKRDFKCDICHKTFNRSHRLTLHLMMHRDERPHKCNLCDKAFRTRTNLRVHIKWHQDQRDYQCEQCGKTFLISGNLDRHMQTHKNGKVPRKRSVRKAPSSEDTEDIKMDLQNPATAQLPLVTDVVQTEDTQYQTVQNIVAGGGFESDLPTLASIAQHLSTMNIPVFQVPNPNIQGTIPVTISGPIPVTIQTNDSTCTSLPGSVMSAGASMAIAAFGQVPSHQQLQNTPVAQTVQGEYDMELTIN